MTVLSENRKYFKQKFENESINFNQLLRGKSALIFFLLTKCGPLNATETNLILTAKGNSSSHILLHELSDLGYVKLVRTIRQSIVLSDVKSKRKIHFGKNSVRNRYTITDKFIKDLLSYAYSNSDYIEGDLDTLLGNSESIPQVPLFIEEFVKNHLIITNKTDQEEFLSSIRAYDLLTPASVNFLDELLFICERVVLFRFLLNQYFLSRKKLEQKLKETYGDLQIFQNELEKTHKESSRNLNSVLYLDESNYLTKITEGTWRLKPDRTLARSFYQNRLVDLPSDENCLLIADFLSRLYQCFKPSNFDFSSCPYLEWKVLLRNIIKMEEQTK